MTRMLYSGRPLSYGHDGDAGIDLYCDAYVIPAGAWVNVPCDNVIAIPPGYWALLTARSSTFFRKHLLVNQAVIDNGYRGPLFTCVYNMGDRAYEVAEGERLAQLILMPLAPRMTLEQVDWVSGNTERGTAGFGSTG